MVRQRTKGFLRTMNIPYMASSALMVVYPALETYMRLTNNYRNYLGWDPIGVYVIPMIFAVMMRTDPFARKWYKEKLRPYIFMSSILPAVGGALMAAGIASGSEKLVSAAVVVQIAGLLIASILIIPRRSGTRALAEYELSVKLAVIWGFLGLVSALASLPGHLDLSVHAIALGFVGNAFLAYSRFLLPYRPFTPGIARSVGQGIIALLNIGALLRLVHPLSLYIETSGYDMPWLADTVSILSSAIIGGSLLAIVIRILMASAKPG